MKASRDQDGAWLQPHWVGDLTLEANLEVTRVAPTRRCGWSWSRRGLPHRCTIELETGMAVVTRGEKELAKWETPIKGPGGIRVELANVDERMTLVVDGKEMGGGGVAYESKDDAGLSRRRPIWLPRPSRSEMLRSWRATLS